MNPENPSRGAELRKEIEQERRESFAGFDSYTGTISPADLHDPVVVGQICKNVSDWALTYRGYKDEDSFYERVDQLSGKLEEYAKDAEDEENFVSDVTRIIDETFPTIEQPVE